LRHGLEVNCLSQKPKLGVEEDASSSLHSLHLSKDSADMLCPNLHSQRSLPGLLQAYASPWTLAPSYVTAACPPTSAIPAPVAAPAQQQTPTQHTKATPARRPPHWGSPLASSPTSPHPPPSTPTRIQLLAPDPSLHVMAPTEERPAQAAPRAGVPCCPCGWAREAVSVGLTRLRGPLGPHCHCHHWGVRRSAAVPHPRTP